MKKEHSHRYSRDYKNNKKIFRNKYKISESLDEMEFLIDKSTTIKEKMNKPINCTSPYPLSKAPGIDYFADKLTKLQETINP